MRKLKFFLAFAGVLTVPLLMGSSCGNHYPTGTSMYGYMPTPTPVSGMSVTVSAVASGYSYQYSPSNITIMHGQTVTWDTSNSNIHTLNIDNGSGTCLVSGVSSFPYTYTFTTAGTYHFHCGVHSSCGNGSCPNPSTCTGMVGTITVN